MTPARVDHPTASLAARLAAPLGAVLAMASLAAFQADRAAAAETAFLALAAGVALVAAAATAPRLAAEGVAGPLLVVTAVWALPEGPARGAVAMALAAGALALAALRWLPDRGGPQRRAPGEGAGDGLPAAPVVALAFGLQALLRAGELLGIGAGAAADGAAAWQPAFRGVALFVVFPAMGAAAVLILARLHGRRRALLVAAAVLVAGPGFRPATLAALLALAAAGWLLAREPLAGAGETTRIALRSAGVALLVAPFAWDPRAAAAGLVAGLAGALVPLAGPGSPPSPERRAGGRPGGEWAAPALAAAALGAALLLPGRPAGEALALAALVPLAVPAVALPGRGRAPLALAALLLAAAAGRGVLVEGALAAPAALAALALPRRGPVFAVQAAWSGALLAAAGLLAAYPWLREAPLPEALGLVGLAPGLPGALSAVVGLAALAGVAALAGRAAAPVAERIGGRAAAAALAGLVLLHLPAAGAFPLGRRTLALDGERRAWEGAIGARAGAAPVRTVVLDSALANAAALAPGTPVATVRLREPGRPDRLWTLRAGSETGEWAADRPDLRPRRPPAPAPWTSWVAEDGAFFGRRYRAVRRLAEPAAAERIELALRPDLPPEVGLRVFHLELRP